MTFARGVQPIVSLLLPGIRTSSRSRWRSANLCTNCSKTLQHSHHLRLSQRRRLATAAAYNPASLDPTPPPRNTGVSETSIGGGRPQVDDEPSQAGLRPSSVSLPESQAQKPSPTSNTGEATGSVASPSPSPRKSKLRPRKAALTLSPSAVGALRDLLNEPSPRLIRVGVKNRGCSGLAYHLEYVEKPGAFDEAVDQDGVKVLIDSKAMFSIIGSEMDWVEDKLSRRFVFRNPNISESSFSSKCLSFYGKAKNMQRNSAAVASLLALLESRP